jgi:hypothetical protein
MLNMQLAQLLAAERQIEIEREIARESLIRRARKQSAPEASERAAPIVTAPRVSRPALRSR